MVRVRVISNFVGLVVRIEQPSYMIRESEGPLEVCGTLSNPAAETITLIGMAGESSPPDARGKY